MWIVWKIVCWFAFSTPTLWAVHKARHGPMTRGFVGYRFVGAGQSAGLSHRFHPVTPSVSMIDVVAEVLYGRSARTIGSPAFQAAKFAKPFLSGLFFGSFWLKSQP
jgi:hypothetical protein